MTLFFLHALRCRSIEQSKHIVGQDFCQILGGSFLRLQSLRYAIDEIVGNPGFDRAIEAYYRDLIALTEKGDRIYYTDGHFSTYYGKRRVPKGWDPRRQKPFKGRNTIYLHNSYGEVVYLFESATNTTLGNDIEKLVCDMERLEMEVKRKTLIFDRGGYSQRCFIFLKRKKMYFITYLKNRKKERRISEEEFKAYEIKLENGDKLVYRLYEGERRWSRSGRVRVIVLMKEDGNQVPILTSHPYMKVESIVYLLARRWREENCFKFMIEHFGIDLLTTYKTEAAPEKRVKRSNPERQAINKEIAKKKNELAKLQMELAMKIATSQKQTMQEFLDDEKELSLAIKNVQVDIDLLMRKREKVASQIEVNLADEHVIMAQKRRLFISAIKAMNYNVEKWLQIRFKKRYHSKVDEILSLIRSLWKQPGRIREDGRLVEVELEAPDGKSIQASVGDFLKDLSQINGLRMADGRLLRIKMMR